MDKPQYLLRQPTNQTRKNNNNNINLWFCYHNLCISTRRIQAENTRCCLDNNLCNIFKLKSLPWIIVQFSVFCVVSHTQRFRRSGRLDKPREQHINSPGSIRLCIKHFWWQGQQKSVFCVNRNLSHSIFIVLRVGRDSWKYDGSSLRIERIWSVHGSNCPRLQFNAMHKL